MEEVSTPSNVKNSVQPTIDDRDNDSYNLSQKITDALNTGLYDVYGNIEEVTSSDNTITIKTKSSLGLISKMTNKRVPLSNVTEQVQLLIRASLGDKALDAFSLEGPTMPAGQDGGVYRIYVVSTAT